MTMIIGGATLLGVSSDSMAHDQKEQTEMIIKTHSSESQGQKEAVRDEQVSYLHIALLKTSEAL